MLMRHPPKLPIIVLWTQDDLMDETEIMTKLRDQEDLQAWSRIYPLLLDGMCLAPVAELDSYALLLAPDTYGAALSTEFFQRMGGMMVETQPGVWGLTSVYGR